MILQADTPIFEDETYGELQVRLSELGALTLVEAMTLVSLGKATETPQDDSRATFAAKVTRESSRINWMDGAIEISRQIRASDPKPGAFTTTPKGEVKLFGPQVMDRGGQAWRFSASGGGNRVWTRRDPGQRSSAGGKEPDDRE
jgi:methionyl-tRNA formyltransferase